MLLTEYDEATTMELFKEEGRQEGRLEGKQEGKAEGADEANKRVASEMLQDGEPLPKIVKYSRLPEAIVRQLAHSLGVAIL